MNLTKLNRYLLLPLIILTGLLFSVQTVNAQFVNPRANIEKMARTMQLLNYGYVDSVNLDKLTEEAIVAMLAKLDPHSVYISKSELAEANEPLQGSFDGIGVQFQIFKQPGCPDTVLVITPVAGGPSDKVGVQAGDKIIQINGESSTGPNATQKYVFDHLRGPRGTKVNITVKRSGSNSLLDFTITRDKIPITSIDASYMLSPGIGYIKLNKFARTTMEEFHQAIEKLKAKGLNSLILDLRNNTGGFMDVAIDMSDQFLSEGKRIVYTKGLHSAKQEFYSTSKGDFETGKLVVMINEGSASASEILAGAIQDWDRGLLIGRRSFGKGLVQRPFDLPDSSEIRLTVARYYTPSGRNIQKSYKDGAESYAEDITTRFKKGELIHADSIHFPDSLKYLTNGKRTVYGGGGIMPDYFIPIDTTSNTHYFLDLYRKGLLNQFPLEYVDANRTKLLAKYPTLEQFKLDYDKDHKLINDFIAYAETQKVKKNDEDLKFSYQDIESILRASVARSLYNSEAYYEVVNGIDHELQKALEIISSDDLFKKNRLNY
ncbi:MAG: S41 family peptidase [Bacteroidota bacterium]|nr:S41 family peptidase [Bacteroidota bacterium]